MGKVRKMSEYFNDASGSQSQSVRDRNGQTFVPNGAREFLPQLSQAQIDKIKTELHGMIGQRTILSNEDVVQIRRAVNIILQEPHPVLVSAMDQARVVAVLSSEPANSAAVIASLYEGGATHLAMNLPKSFQPILDTFQASGIEEVLSDLPRARSFKHPIKLLAGAVSLGIKLLAVGDQQVDQSDRKVATIESIALDVANVLDERKSNKVVLWAGSQYIKRSGNRKNCQSALDYLALNYSVYSVHNGNYLIDGGPLRKIVFDLQCPGIIVTGRNRIIDNLYTGLEGDTYGHWNAILMQPRPSLDFSYFLTSE